MARTTRNVKPGVELEIDTHERTVQLVTAGSTDPTFSEEEFVDLVAQVNSAFYRAPAELTAVEEADKLGVWTDDDDTRPPAELDVDEQRPERDITPADALQLLESRGYVVYLRAEGESGPPARVEASAFREVDHPTRPQVDPASESWGPEVDPEAGTPRAAAELGVGNEANAAPGTSGSEAHKANVTAGLSERGDAESLPNTPIVAGETTSGGQVNDDDEDDSETVDDDDDGKPGADKPKAAKAKKAKADKPAKRRS